MDEEKLNRSRRDDEEKLNRSRRDRLTKAAKQGYGPWADIHARSQSSEGALRTRHTLAAVSEHAPRAPLLKQQRQVTSKRALEDEPDLSGFLAPKPPGAAQKRAQGLTVSIQALPSNQPSAASRLELRIAPGTNERAMAANAGARPKATARSGKPPIPDDLIQPQSEELGLAGSEAGKGDGNRGAPRHEGAREYEAQERGELSQLPWSDEVPDDEDQLEHLKSESHLERSRDVQRHIQQEQKRKRDEWRKSWKEEKRRRGMKQQRSRSRDEDSESQMSRERSENRKSRESRAITWSVLNNSGVMTARDADRKPVGQLTDADLDRRLREREANAEEQKLMSEAEVLAKLNRKRGKPHDVKQR